MDEDFSDPWRAGINNDHIPREQEQFLIAGEGDSRAFSVQTVEWHFDKDEVHLFCIEYPREDPPE
jgi:hypothetical protein